MKKTIAFIILITFICSFSGCSNQSKAVIKEEDIHAICELATLKCYYNNVAQIDKKKDNIFQKDRKMWIEYEGVATIGVDMSQIKIETSGNTITITMPEAELLSLGVNTDTFGEKLVVSSDKGWFDSKINSEEQNQAMLKGDEEMEKALQQPVLEQIRTVVKAKDTEGDIVRYQNDQVTSQKVISEEEEQFTYRSWMKVKSVESALGYTSVLLDLDAILYPKTEEDRWENIGKEFAANLSTYWKLFSGFDGTTVSECDTRIRTFLNSRYEDDREDNAITLRTTGTDETAYYVLRTHNEDVRKVTGGTAEKLEDSAWLIRAEQSEVRITLGASDQRYYYEKGAKNE